MIEVVLWHKNTTSKKTQEIIKKSFGSFRMSGIGSFQVGFPSFQVALICFFCVMYSRLFELVLVFFSCPVGFSLFQVGSIVVGGCRLPKSCFVFVFSVVVGC